MPSDFPFTDTSARFFTSPRSIQMRPSFPNQPAGAFTTFVYVPVPEKYFTPASGLSLQDESASNVILGGAPRPGWKATFQGPSNVASGVSLASGSTFEVSEVGLRKTTKTDPHGSRCKGTVVSPLA